MYMERNLTKKTRDNRQQTKLDISQIASDQGKFRARLVCEHERITDLRPPVPIFPRDFQK